MILNKILLSEKVRRTFTLALYIGFTIAIYSIFCHFMKREFQEIHLLYATLVGCIAYLPRFIADRKKAKEKK